MDISLSLPPELIRLIEAKVAAGPYASASDVVSEALRVLELAEQEQARQSDRLRDAWDVGIASGSAGPLDFVELRATARRLHALTYKR